jgi:structural maintenance of chromosome 2
MSQASYAKVEAKLQAERATLAGFDNELKDLEKVIKAKKQSISDADLELKKIEHDIQSLGKERTAAANHAQGLEKQFDWILDEQEYVHISSPRRLPQLTDMLLQAIRQTWGSIRLCHSEHEPVERQGQGARGEIKRHEEEDQPKVGAHDRQVAHHSAKQALICTDCLCSFSVEKQESELKKMLAQVMKDKEKIEQTIEELDRYKRDALEKTWSKVNGQVNPLGIGCRSG